MIFFFSFFFFFYLKRRRCQEKVFETKGQKWEGKSKSQKWEGKVGGQKLEPKVRGQKWEPKMKGHNDSLNESSLPSLHFFSYLWLFFLFYFSFAWEKEDAKKKCLKQKGRSESQKWEGKVGAWRKAPSLISISLLLYGFFFLCFFPFLLLEKKKILKESVWNRRVQVGAKSERTKKELEGKLPPFSWFFF